jgi:hypothetical protein
MRMGLIVAAVLAAVAFTAAPASAATCTPPAYPGNGSITSLSVTKVSCTTGKKVALAYYKCRTKTGPTGRCVSKVLGYACIEQRTTTAAGINAKVTCKNKKKRVVHAYQQNP